MLNSNKPIKVVHLQKLANQWMLNDALVTEMANNCFSDSMKSKLWSFEKVRNVLIEKKNEIWAAKNIFLLHFTKYLSYSEVQNNSKVVDV